MSFIDSDGLPSIDPSQLPSIEPQETQTYEPATPAPSAPAAPAQTEGSPTEPSFSGFMKQIYDKVPENLRPQVAQHLKEADTGFTKYAQETQARIRNYEQLGSVEDLQLARTVYQTILTDPQRIYDYLVHPEGGGLTPKQATQAVAQATEELTGQPADPRIEAMSKELQDTKKLVAAQYAHTQQQAEKAQQEENTKLYFETLDSLDKQFESRGKVHDRKIIHRLVSGGLDPDQAYEEYFAWRDSMVTPSPTRQAPAPTVMSGGTVPRTAKPLKEMTPDEQNSYMEEALMAMQRERQN